MQTPRKLSAQNAMASINRTLGRPSRVRGNAVKLAGEEAKDRLYMPRHRQKVFRVMTVIAYMISVSLAAILLSLYYIFFWDPKVKQSAKHNITTKADCVTTLPTGKSNLPIYLLLIYTKLLENSIFHQKNQFLQKLLVQSAYSSY